MTSYTRDSDDIIKIFNAFKRFLAIVPQQGKCLKFTAFQGIFCIEYSQFYPPKQT